MKSKALKMILNGLMVIAFFIGSVNGYPAFAEEEIQPDMHAESSLHDEEDMDAEEVLPEETENPDEETEPVEDTEELFRQALHARQLPPVQQVEIQSAGVDALTIENGHYLYNLIQDSAQTFNLTFPEQLFDENRDKGNLTVTIKLPKYGMAFTDNMVSDLLSAEQIKSASFIKDSNGYNTTLTFVMDGGINQQYLSAFSTKYVPLSKNQCADIIQNGWQESPIEIVVKNGAGDIVSTNTKYVMKPGTYSGTDVRIPEHVNTTSALARHANMPLYGNTFGNYSLGGGQDNLYLNVPVVSHNDTELMCIDEIKFYIPDDRFDLVNVIKTPAQWSQYTGPQAAADYQFTDYFSTDYVKRHDAKGTYYTFKPKTPFYNSGSKEHPEQAMYGSRLIWKISNDLESEATYTAPDTEIVATKAGGEAISIFHKGTVVKTLKTVFKDTFSWIPYANYKLNGITTTAKYIPGASYYKVPFIQMQNFDSFDKGTMTTYQTINGKVTEEYDFPYEIQPMAWKPYIHGNTNGNMSTVHAITYTVIKADGTTQDFNEVMDKPVKGDYSVYLDFSAHLSPGDRVSKVKIDWSEMHSLHHTCSGFDYTVTTTHEDGSSLVNGDLLHIGYTSHTSENGKSFAGTVNQANRYIYLSYGELLCPWLNAYGSNYQMYNVKTLNDSEVVLVPQLFLKVNAGAGKKYSENPVIDLKVKLNNVKEEIGGPAISDGTFMLSGNMTMTKNMSDWKFEYTVIDKTTKAVRTGSYQVGTLTGDTPLTRAMLGLSESEAFLTLSIRYNGKFVFKETIRDEQKSSQSDSSPAGFYELTPLLKDIKAYTSSQSTADKDLITLSKAYREGSTMFFDAVYTHSDACSGNKKNFFYGASVWNFPAYIISSTRAYTINGPGFSSQIQSTVIQANTFTAAIQFDLKAYANTEYLNDTYLKMPHDIPEQMFIELTDSDFTLDKTNAAFRQSLQEHGMSEDDVEEVNIAGKRWIRLNIKKAKDKSKQLNGGSKSLSSATTLKNKFVIALNAWEGAVIGTHHPFGEVYFDQSALLKKYNGDKDSGYVTEVFSGAIADPYNLLKDGDHTTKRLWRGDLSGKTVEVLRNVAIGIKLYPVKGTTVYRDHTVGFVEEERENLAAVLQLKMAENDVYNYEVITKIPVAQEEIDYDYVDTDNSLKTGRKKSEYTLYLSSPAQIKKNSLKHGVVKFTYSKDGVNFVEESMIAPADFKDYRYVKTSVDVFEKYEVLHLGFPLSCAMKTELPERKAYIGGTYRYDTSSSLPTTTVTGNLMYGEYVYQNYTLSGKIFWDKDEDGFNLVDDPAKNITLQLFSPHENIHDQYGNTVNADTLIATVKTGNDGIFHFSSFINQADQKIIMTTNADVKLTRRSMATVFDRGDDSDFDRVTKSLLLPKLSKEKNENISGGLIHLPLLTASDVAVHVKDTKAHNISSQSENPHQPHPPITYTLISGDADLANLTSVNVTGNKIGEQTLKASITNTLGDVVTKEFKVKVYANVIYDANGGSGSAFIDPKQYTDANDLVTVMGHSSLFKAGYIFTGWSKDQNASQPQYVPNAVFTFDETEKDVVLYAVFRYLPTMGIAMMPIWKYAVCMGIWAAAFLLLRKNRRKKI